MPKTSHFVTRVTKQPLKSHKQIYRITSYTKHTFSRQVKWLEGQEGSSNDTVFGTGELEVDHTQMEQQIMLQKIAKYENNMQMEYFQNCSIQAQQPTLLQFCKMTSQLNLTQLRKIRNEAQLHSLEKVGYLMPFKKERLVEQQATETPLRSNAKAEKLKSYEHDQISVTK